MLLFNPHSTRSDVALTEVLQQVAATPKYEYLNAYKSASYKNNDGHFGFCQGGLLYCINHLNQTRI